MALTEMGKTILAVLLVTLFHQSPGQFMGNAGPAAGGVQFPSISCPQLFAYQYDPNYGGWYGQVTTPKTNKLAQEFDVEVNMTINKQVNENENIKLQVMSGNDEVFNGDQIKWAVKFPYQDVLPKIIQIKFNQAVICTNPGDPMSPGVVQTSMWAKATIKTANQGGQGSPQGTGGSMPGMPAAPGDQKTGEVKHETQEEHKELGKPPLIVITDMD